MVDLKAIAEHITANDLWHKPMIEWSKQEMLELGKAFFSAIGAEVPCDGWKKPFIENGKLVFPADVGPKYRWWTGCGQSLIDTLVELDASWQVVKKYVQTGLWEGVWKEREQK